MQVANGWRSRSTLMRAGGWDWAPSRCSPGTRERHFEGTHFKPHKRLENAHAVPTGSSPTSPPWLPVRTCPREVHAVLGMSWMALAMAVPTRRWLGGVVGRKRDLDLIQSLVDKVRAIALCRPLLLAADGLVSYVTAFRMAFRSQVPHGRDEMGRCRLVSARDCHGASGETAGRRCADN